MLIRIVKMTFQPEKVDEFLELFDSKKEAIRATEGCEHLELIRQIDQPNVMMTYSFWRGEEHLKNYKNTDVFKEVWPKTKALFAARPEAWSMERLELLE
ncbi:putative quinol monooxygenase [Halocola ammonii]